MEGIYNKGAYTTMITPYKADGSVDFETAKKYVRWYAQKGCDGIFAVCQSSEIFFLNEDERVELNRTVWNEMKAIERETGKRMTIVSSGHVSERLEDQARDLTRIAETGTDALILITNRLDLNNEGDDVFIANAEKLLKMLPEDVALGFYECPYPYKRLLTPRILEWCLSTGRFRFIKDTCCDAGIIRTRLNILKDSPFLLFNANGQTLLRSLRDGAAGYCGIMANFHPELYVRLCHHFDEDPAMADLLESFICTSCATEGALPYPLSAKYHMGLEGIPTENYARCRQASDLTIYMKMCTQHLRTLAQFMAKVTEQWA